MTTLDRRDRLAAGLVAGAVVAALLWALIVGLSIGHGGRIDDGLKLFGVLPPDPPPPAKVVPPHVRNFRPAGAAAPPNLRARPTEIVAPVASTDGQASAGAAEVAGPGTGAGGEGDGFGAGGDGDGDGAGDVPPRRTGGRIRDSDYPLDAGEQGISGTVGVRFVVDVHGRVPRCAVTRSSGSRLLDDTTCRLIVQRYRFRPGHDARGVPFESTIVENESWLIREEPEDRE